MLRHGLCQAEEVLVTLLDVLGHLFATLLQHLLHLCPQLSHLVCHKALQLVVSLLQQRI